MTQQAAENDWADRLLANAAAGGSPFHDATHSFSSARRVVRAAGRDDRAVPCLAVDRCSGSRRRIQMLEKHDNALSRFVRPGSLPIAATRPGPSTDSSRPFRPLLSPIPKHSCTVPDCWPSRPLFRSDRRSAVGPAVVPSLRILREEREVVGSRRGVGPLAASPHGEARRPGQFDHGALDTRFALGRISLRPAVGNLRRRLRKLPAGDSRSKSGLYRFRSELVVLLLNSRDLSLPPRAGTGTRRVRRPPAPSVEDFARPKPVSSRAGRLRRASARRWGSLEDALPEGRRRVIAESNQALAADLPQGVSFVDANAVAAEIGEEYWSASEWHAAKQYPSAAALPRLADAICAHAAAALGLSAKVLAVDLDNTLWGGVIGEDLLGGNSHRSCTPEGEGYRELQQYLKELQQRGVLLAVCSKNNLADAELPFLRHEDMLLKRDDFAAFVANWDDKPANLERIAKDLSLGLDSFVFLDDNPLERALVRSRLPQVIVPECGEAPGKCWRPCAAGCTSRP